MTWIMQIQLKDHFPDMFKVNYWHNHQRCKQQKQTGEHVNNSVLYATHMRENIYDRAVMCQIASVQKKDKYSWSYK